MHIGVCLCVLQPRSPLSSSDEELVSRKVGLPLCVVLCVCLNLFIY